MTSLLPWEKSDRMRIGTLRLRGAGEDRTAARLAVSALLDRTDLAPAIPPSAVLIVRTMADPLPQRVPLRLGANRIDAAWERAARRRLAELYRDAARPRHGPVPPQAAAVAFADESELMACLAYDLVAGLALEHWWWKRLLAVLPQSPATRLAVLLRDRPAAVPAALTLLARQGRASDIVRALPPGAALAVLAAVGATYGLLDLAQPIAAPPFAPENRRDAPPGDRSISERTARATAQRAAASADIEHPIQRDPPWSNLLPSGTVPADLDRPQACLLAVSLILQRRPEAARGSRFAAALRHWLHAAPPEARSAQRAPAHVTPDAPAVSRSNDATATPERAGAAKADGNAAHVATVKSSPPAKPASPAGARVTPSQLAEPDAPHSTQEISPLPRAAGEHDAAASDVVTPRVPPHRAQAPDAARFASAAHAPAPKGPASEPPRSRTSSPIATGDSDAAPTAREDGATHETSDIDWEGGIDTRLGGIFFLVNLMISLDLPECFEPDWRLADRLGPWGVLEALARGLAPDDAPVNDLIWAALAALSRDDGKPLGAGLPRRARYRLPAAWPSLPDAIGQTHLWASRGARLRVWEQAGYLLSEIPREGSRSAAGARRESALHARGMTAQLSRAAFDSAPVADMSGPLVRPLDPALRRWLSLVLPYIRLRLAMALGTDAAETRPEHDLLRRGGRLYVTRTHVDVMMRLDSVSLPVRFAGLDRNPGWLTAFGRVISFHFE
jgi:hypothetical protein